MVAKKLAKKEGNVTLTLRGSSADLIPAIGKISKARGLMVKTPADGWQKASVLKKYFK